MLYADILGERRAARPGLVGRCPGCGAALIAKCGAINAWHWAHLAAVDCDRWSEPTGPWHLAWQNAVDPRFVEAPYGKHRADLVGNDGCVIELQHSAISADEIQEREDFYRDMIWLFDATHRFRSVRSGEWTFFSLGRTKHLSRCRKPVFLDFGDRLIEVISFTDVLPEIHGFGIERNRPWFMERYLSDVVVDDVAVVFSQDRQPDPWAERRPHRPVGFPTKWTIDGELRILPAETAMIALDVPRRGRRSSIAEELIDGDSELASGWSKSALNEMGRFLRGTAIILEGRLRMMPALLDDARWHERPNVSPLSVHAALRESEDHARAGRIPILKEATKRTMIERTFAGMKTHPERHGGTRPWRQVY